MNGEQLKEQAGQYTQQAIVAGRHIGSRVLSGSSDVLSKASLKMSEAATQLESSSSNRSRALKIAGTSLGVGAVAASFAASKILRKSQQHMGNPNVYPMDTLVSDEVGHFDEPVSTPIRSEGDRLDVSIPPRMTTEALLDRPE